MRQSHDGLLTLCLSLLLLLGLHVRLNEEVGEEEEKRQNVNDVCCSDLNGKSVASVDDKVSSLRHHGNELDQLHQSQVRLPPDRDRDSGLLVLGVHADEVVGVHDGVDESVEENGYIDVTIVENVRVEPVK